MFHQVISPVGPKTSVTSLRRKDQRERFLAELQSVLAAFDVRTEITAYSDRHFVAVFSNDLIAADVDFDGLDPAPSMINWHKAAKSLAEVPGVWTEKMINSFHRRKTTSFPSTYSELMTMLLVGFAAAADGSVSGKTNPRKLVVPEILL